MLELQISQKDVEYPGNDERTKHIGRNCQTKLPCSPSHRESQVWHGETSVSTGVHLFFCFQVNKTGDILESPTPPLSIFLFTVSTMSAYISGHSEQPSPQNHLVSDWRGITIQPGVVGSL